MIDGRVPFDGSLTLSPGCVVYVGPVGVAEMHAHHAVQLVIARNAPFSLTRDGRTTETRVALVPASVPHALDAFGHDVVIVLFERHGLEGRALDRVARDGLSDEQREGLLAVPFPGDAVGIAALRRACAALIVEPRTPRFTREVSLAIAELGRRIGTGEAHGLVHVAAHVGLSPTRLTHRFSSEVGLPYRAFVPWLRVARAVREVQASRASGLAPNLTRAALAAGFVDSAHLTRCFRALFGMPPSVVLSHARIDGFYDDVR